MKLLIVEDEAQLRRNLAQVFREEGYSIDLATDGKDGWHKAENLDYDAIILDVMLPGLDGWEVLRRLRAKKRTPVLMLTARDSIQDRIRGLDLGSDDYLVKPFNISELLARLRALIRRSSREVQPSICLGSILVDTARQKLFRDGEEIDLTAREYALVEFLTLRRGHVVSRNELYDRLFADDEECFSNLLDVHICNVRRKVSRDFIQTRRGQGYIIEEA